MEFLLALYNQPRLVPAGDELILLSGWFRLTAWCISTAALALISWFLVRGNRGRRYGWLGFGVCLATIGIVIPGVVGERITISPEALRIETGLWFEPIVIDYRLGDFERAYEVRRRTHWYRTDLFLILEPREGPRRRYRMSDFFRANRELIFARLAAAGLPVERAPPE